LDSPMRDELPAARTRAAIKGIPDGIPRINKKWECL
jgi:hypothetical protein